MHSTSHLRARANEQIRAAAALLASKGDRPWNKDEQARYDEMLDDAENCQAAIAAVRNQGGGTATAAAAFQFKAFERFIRTGDPGAGAQAAMTTLTGSSGGYVVGPSVAAEFADAMRGYGWMRQVAGQETTQSGASLNWPTSDGSSEIGELMSENSAANAQDPSFGTVPIPTYKVGSKVITLPWELLQDSGIDIVAFVLRRIRVRIGRRQNLQFTQGSGSGEPTGLTVAAGVGKVGATGQTATILYDDLVDLCDSVDDGALGMPDAEDRPTGDAPGWMLSQTTRKVVRKIKDSQGRPIWVPEFLEAVPSVRRPQAYLLGHPVFINNDMPAPAANAKSVAFGNLARYQIRDIQGLQVYRLSDSAYTTKGQVGFVGVARAGGNLLDTGAVKLYQHSAS